MLRLDTEDELFKPLHLGVEAEVNFGAGQLILQGGRFHRTALKDQVSMRTPLALCKRLRRLPARRAALLRPGTP